MNLINKHLKILIKMLLQKIIFHFLKVYIERYLIEYVNCTEINKSIFPLCL